MKPEIIFTSARMHCRHWKTEDLQAIYEVYADVEGARWVGDGTPITLAECEEWLLVTANNYCTRGYGMFALEDRESRQVMGFCGLVHPGGQSEAEIKYAFLRRHWGRGLASEAVPYLLAYGNKNHGLQRIIATVAEPNLASRRVLEKSGMQLCNHLPEEHGSRTLVYEWHMA